VFRGNLKRMFNKHDTDNSGALSMSEIRALLKDNLKEHAIKFKVTHILYD
jgi:Ca2+-binding EF-hand superfamily protein